MEIVTAIAAHWQEIAIQLGLALGGLVALLTALYAIALIVPGDQPDKALKAALDFTKKYSRK